MLYPDVPVKCKKCQKMAPSSEFTIDPYYKLAVCRACAKEAHGSPKAKYIPKEIQRQTNSFTNTLEQENKFEFDNSTFKEKKIKIKCTRCKYTFNYSPNKNSPNKCPYCGTLIKK